MRRYVALAKEASAKGDTVEAENCYQHAAALFQSDERTDKMMLISLLWREA